MKKNIASHIGLILFSVALLSVSNPLHAQEWYHGKKYGMYSVGIGGTQGIQVGSGTGDFGYLTRVSFLGLSINGSGEYMVHKWVSVGWMTGFNFYFHKGYFGYGDYTTMSIPFIAKANFHILSAIKGVKIKDKLDLYAGLSFGGGPAFFIKNGGTASTFGIIHVGPQFGTRYWITKNIGVFLEAGWGATFINAGATF